MSTNRELIRKATEFITGDLASGGALNTEQANAFIRKLIVQPTILQDARLVVMNAPSREINKIGFANRILRPGTEGPGSALTSTGPATTGFAEPTTEQVVLQTVKVIAEVRLSYEMIEDNIERGLINANNPNGPSTNPISGGLKDTIVTLMAEKAAADLEELAIQGDTGSGDPYLAQLDGFLVQSTSNVVDNLSAGIGTDLFKSGLQAMPDQYKRNRPAMRNHVAWNNEIEYRSILGGRETALGDGLITNSGPVFGYGVPVAGAGFMPATSGLLTNPLNYIFGIQRQVSIEVDKDISNQMFHIVLSARVDFKYEEEEAVVKYINI